jgi:hypothetical protein
MEELPALAGRSAFRNIVSDLVRKGPIWFGGQDRTEASMDLFFNELGNPENSAGKGDRVLRQSFL